MARYKVLTDRNPKLLKGEKEGWVSLALHLLPWTFSGRQVCPGANGCQWTCLAFSGRGAMEKSVKARQRRTDMFFDDREGLLKLVVKDICKGLEVAEDMDMKLAIRLNGTSDIPWEKIRVRHKGVEYRNFMNLFPDVMFYDYTSVRGRVIDDRNYHLTYSDKGDALSLLNQGKNVSMIFDGEIPREYMGYPVVNGDYNDLRFLDPYPCVVGLRRKATLLPGQFLVDEAA